VSVTVVEPAAVASAFISNVGLDQVETIAADEVYGAALRAYLERASASFSSAQPADEAGRVIAALLDGDAPAFRLQTSDAARQFVGVKLADLDGSVVQRMTGSWLV